jgi:hypothetical protein
MKTIIKGAIYTDGETLLRPHYSGEFYAVDCTEYKTNEEIKANYVKKYVKELKDAFYLTYEGVKYYECDYSPYYTDNMDLLSDIDKLEYYDEETDF